MTKNGFRKIRDKISEGFKTLFRACGCCCFGYCEEPEHAFDRFAAERINLHPTLGESLLTTDSDSPGRYAVNHIRYDDLPIEDMTEIENLIENLNIVANIKSGEKIFVDNDKISVDNSTFQYLSRWWYDQGATKSLDFITELVDKSERYIVYRDLDMVLRDVKLGLDCMRNTYQSRDDVLQKIEDCLKRIDRILINMAV